MQSVYLAVPLATFIYVLIDVYVVIGSFLALVRSGSFWLYCILFSILNFVAFSVFKQATTTIAGQPTDRFPGSFLVLFFTLIGTFSIIQSFSLKFADYKAIDLEQMFDKLRARLLTDAASEKAGLDKASKIRLARKLIVHYSANPESIDRDYSTLMTFGGRVDADVQREITDSGLSPDPKIRTLVNRMVFADERGARQFLA